MHFPISFSDKIDRRAACSRVVDQVRKGDLCLRTFKQLELPVFFLRDRGDGLVDEEAGDCLLVEEGFGIREIFRSILFGMHDVEGVEKAEEPVSFLAVFRQDEMDVGNHSR